MTRPAPPPGAPVVHLYTICWNEAAMLPFFFRHYDPVVHRYVFHDDGSTDGTLEILRAHPRVEIRPFRRVIATSYVLSAQKLHETGWQDARGVADWVIWTAVDEHLHVPEGGLGPYIAGCHAGGITFAPAMGYQMVADGFPPPDALLCRDYTQGAPYDLMCKLSLFRPDAIEATGYGVGRHTAAPRGRLVYPAEDALLLLHYKYLGRDYTAGRNALLATGLGAIDKTYGWGAQYSAGEAALAAEFADFAARAVDITQPPAYPHPLWWRRDRE